MQSSYEILGARPNKRTTAKSEVEAGLPVSALGPRSCRVSEGTLRRASIEYNAATRCVRALPRKRGLRSRDGLSTYERPLDEISGPTSAVTRR